MKKILIYLLSFLLAGALGFGGVYLIKPKLTTKAPAVGSPYVVPTADVLPVLDTIPEEDPGLDEFAEEEPSVLEIDITAKKVTRLSNGGFKVSGLKVKGSSGDNVKFILSDNENHVYESYDGSFADVVQPNARGYYNAKVRDLRSGKESAAKALYGFRDLKPVEKLSASELAAMFNSGTSSSMAPLRDRMAGNVKIKSNFPDVTTPSDVFLRVANEDLHVTVTSVHYDASGRADVINLELK